MSGAGADPIWSKPESALGPRNSGAGRSRPKKWRLCITVISSMLRSNFAGSDIWLGQNSEDLSFAVPGSVLPGRVSAATGTVSAFRGTSRAVRHQATAHVACVSQVSEPDTTEEQGNILDLLEGFRSRVARFRLQLKF